MQVKPKSTVAVSLIITLPIYGFVLWLMKDDVLMGLALCAFFLCIIIVPGLLATYEVSYGVIEFKYWKIPVWKRSFSSSDIQLRSNNTLFVSGKQILWMTPGGKEMERFVALLKAYSSDSQ